MEGEKGFEDCGKFQKSFFKFQNPKGIVNDETQPSLV